MVTPMTREGIESSDFSDLLRELIPRYTRAGVLRRTGLPDGGVQFVEALTDRVFATFDGRGRLVV